MYILDILKMIWPFLKEMVLGKATLKYAFKRNKLKVFFLLSIIVSYAANWYFVPKVFTISAHQVEVVRANTELKEKLKSCTETNDYYRQAIFEKTDFISNDKNKKEDNKPVKEVKPSTEAVVPRIYKPKQSVNDRLKNME